MAMDRGEYIRIGQLSPSSTEEELLRGYTYRHADSFQYDLLVKPSDVIQFNNVMR